jgi:hypothetical protein
MHWTLPQLRALTPSQHAALVQWLTEQQEAAQARADAY